MGAAAKNRSQPTLAGFGVTIAQGLKFNSIAVLQVTAINCFFGLWLCVRFICKKNMQMGVWHSEKCNVVHGSHLKPHRVQRS